MNGRARADAPVARPDFIIAGAAKCGTTTLATVLAQAPDIFMSAVKEPKFFSVPYRPHPMNGPGDERDYHAKPRTLEAYEALFAAAAPGAIRGEASTDYLFYAQSAKDIRATCGDIRIVIILREPVARLLSQYTHMVREGHETLPLEEALAQEADRKAGGYQYSWLYFENGLYSERLGCFLAAFSHVEVLIFEEFFRDPVAGYNRLLDRLGSGFRFSSDDAVSGVRENVSGVPRLRLLYRLATSRPAKSLLGLPMRIPAVKRLLRGIQHRLLRRPHMAEATRARLAERYAEDVARVEALLGRPIEAWR